MSWRCFHCDESFDDADSAAAHFGTREWHNPACKIDAAEYRRMEAREASYAEEDAEIHRMMRRMESLHQQSLRRAEEAGYAKGLQAYTELQAKLDAVTKDAGGWLRAVDEALVIAHLDVANASDDYATARRKLGQLIDWHVAVATDPAVNGGDRLIAEALLREILDDCKGVGVEPCIGSMAPFEDLCGRIELALTDQGRAGDVE